MNQVSFKIFVSSNQITLSANLIIYSVLSICLATMYITSPEDDTYLWPLTSIIAIATMFSGLFMKFIQGSLIKKYRGYFQGELVFEEEKISVNKIEYSMNNIMKIDFNKWTDYYDSKENAAKGDFNPSRSNGTSNQLKLELFNGQTKTIRFQLTFENSFNQLNDLLIHYHLNDKIHFLKLIDYLMIKDYDEIQEFKETLRKKKKNKYNR